MPFTILPFNDKYQSEVIDLIERIQVAEFNIPIEPGQRKELQSISQAFQKNKGCQQLNNLKTHKDDNDKIFA